MKKSITAAVVALFAILPFSYVAAAPISGTVKDSIAAVVSVDKPTPESLDSLIAALTAEVKVQGLDNVKTIAAQVMANAKSPESAKALAKAMSTAALMVAKQFEEDLNGVASDLASGILEGTPAEFQSDAIAEAVADASEIGGAEVADSITEVVQDQEAPEVVAPSGDAGETPAVDLSSDTGVSD